MITEAIKDRILLLDGATGTMLQKGYDVATIHRMYIEAGADIIETDTFNLKGYDDTFSKSRIARCVADEAIAATGREIWVAGILGPWSKILTLADNIQHPSDRSCSFEELTAIYRENASALMDAGVDVIMMETFFDAINLRAALYAVTTLEEERGIKMPVMVSATINDRCGRLLTGMQIDALYNCVKGYDLLSFGLNCSFGAEEMAPVIEQISRYACCAVSLHPNAGLPNQFGGYDQTPEQMADIIRGLAVKGCVNIAGGCCGTTPEHISALRKALEGVKPREIPQDTDNALVVTGLESYRIDLATTNFVNVGERTNVAGSRKFARLIGEGNFEEAATIARRQIENGASVIDINMDDAMLDSRKAMTDFTRYINNDPDIAKAAYMIDSSDWETIVSGMRNAPGRCIVNSISLKEGEETFLRKAREIRRHGAAVIVMAFDEEGQATTYERKVAICERAYRLLTASAGFRPQDIVFDVNVLTVGTGMAEHADYAVDFIRAVRWIKENLPGCHTSGGVSNLSFSFRGNNPVREAMHSVFLYHAIEAGLDMAIVNPGMLQIYTEIEPSLRKAAEDVILNSDSQATERLTELAEVIKGSQTSGAAPERKEEWRELDFERRLIHALTHGINDYLDVDLEEALEAMDPIDIIEGTLLKGMERVGDLFGKGQMFLPQVIKSARTMRMAVDRLQPRIASSSGHKPRRRMILATAKGDVHDIGKNILAVILSCNDIEITDLGVMVDNTAIIEAIRTVKPDFVGVSGLITPSLAYMEELCRMMQDEGFKIPLFIGGATTSALHTAIKLAPFYDGGVIYTASASDCANSINRLIRNEAAERRAVEESQENLRRMYEQRGEKFLSVEEARERAPKHPLSSFVQDEGFGEKDLSARVVDLSYLVRKIDWQMFLAFWGFKGRFPEMLEGNPKASECYEEGMTVLSKMIFLHDVNVSARVKFFDACREEETIILPECGARFPVPRSLAAKELCPSLADFFPEAGSGLTTRIGIFAVTVHDLAPHCCDEGCRDYDHLMRQSLCQRLAEAAAEWLQEEVTPAEEPRCRTIRPAFGYAACPDHSLKRTAFDLLGVEKDFSMRLTESFAMIPAPSVCGMLISHPEAKIPDIRLPR